MVDIIMEKYKLNKESINRKDLLLKEITFNNNNLEDISKFENLEILIIKNSVLDRKTLKEINNLKNLKVIYFKNVVFKSRFSFFNSFEKIYFDSCVDYEKIKFKMLNKVEILNSYINNKVFKKIRKILDIRINNCKISKNIKYKLISNVETFYLNNVNLETNIFLSYFKKVKIINLDGTNIVNKIDIPNMKNSEKYYKIREVI